VNETYLTVNGRVVTNPRAVIVNGGLPITSFRVVSTTRKYDRSSGGWVDGESIWLTVTCFRALASNVAKSIGKGDRVVVHGRLRVKEWTGDDEQRRLTVEIEADAVGHDLTFGTSVITRVARVEPAHVPGRAEADQLMRLAEVETGEPDDLEVDESSDELAHLDIDETTGEILRTGLVREG
jgi:single-strand DNA-binding protein